VQRLGSELGASALQLELVQADLSGERDRVCQIRDQLERKVSGSGQWVQQQQQQQHAALFSVVAVWAGVGLLALRQVGHAAYTRREGRGTVVHGVHNGGANRLQIMAASSRVACWQVRAMAAA
jgi:hypothetical protein